MVRGNIMGKQTIYQSTSDFFRSDNTASRASVCDNPNCHAKPLGNTTTPGTILYDVQEHRDVDVQVGTVCTTCHNHSSTTGGDSFAPVCNSCHTYPGQATIGGTHTLSAVHTRHVASDNTGGYAFSCNVCHYKYNHNQSSVNNAGEWGSKFQSSNVNIKFDGSWNPLNANGPRYAGVAADNTLADNVYAPGNGGTGVCAGLYCHGNSTTVASWPAGSNTAPSWNTPSTGACGACHKYLANDPPSTYAHPKHSDNTTIGYAISCAKCHYATTADGLTIASRSAHLNRQSDITFDTTDTRLSSGVYSGTTTVGDSGTTTGTCSNIYCHSPGVRTGPPFDNGALGVPDWNTAGPLVCNACHGSLANASGTPAYANGTPKINSHSRHIIMGYGCRACHVNTTTTDNTITNRANHVDGIYNVNPDNAAHNFTTPYVSPNCSAIACHGNNAAVWGGTPPLCGQCHLSTVDTDQYQTASANWFGNDNTGTISSTEWSFSGHGKTSGTYTVSGHNAADFPGGAGTGDPCTYCHDSTVAHRLATNPFRLKDQAGVSGYATAGWNATCLVCHSKTQAPPGYTPAGVPFSRNSATGDRVDTAHYGSLHVADNTLGGRLCWDCHDGHGDSPDSSGNIYMIQKQTLSKTDGVYGYRGTSGTQTGAIVFANDNAPLSGGDWADNTSPYNGICNVCHTTAGHYRTNSGDAHNRDRKCTDCHDHDQNFAASCNACHGEASGPGAGGAPPYAPFSGHPWASRTTVDNLSSLAGVGDHRTATGIGSSSHESFACSECHTSSSGSDAAHDTGKTNASMTQIGTHNWYIAGVNASWSAGALAGAVSGGSVVDDSCANINCHSPYYGAPANQYKSGTPAPYTRYWLNQTLWDCYTCHAYDGRTATARPAGADNTMATGMHTRHVAFQQYACSRCHDVTGYSSTTWPNTNAGHKNGFINWSFAGSPNPYGATPSYSIATGTAAPTDDNTTAGHTSWGSCSNLYCHSVGQKATGAALTGAAGEYLAPAWDNALTGRCGTCHKSDGVQGTATRMDSGSHTKHVGAAPYAYACTACHNGLGSGVVSHADNQVNLAFGTILNGTTIGATYNQGNTHPVGNGFGNCTATYCHGTGTPALTGGANQAGAPNLPTWNDNTTNRCGSCHGGPGGSTNYPGKASDYPTSGAHARHMSDVIGPRITACTDCHTADTSSTHVDGKVDLRTRFDNTAATTLALTQTCDPCHGSGVATAKTNWSTVASVDCLTCHGSTPAYTYANATGRVAPNMAGDNSTYGANVRGHNRPTASGVYPVTGNPAANRTCDSCHNLAIAHIDGTDNTTYTGNRLLDNVNNVTPITTVSGLCAACHTNAGTSPATKKDINTHGNAGYTGRLEAVFTGLNCAQCHEPHGMVNVSTGTTGVNLWMINPTITVTTGVTVSPVRLFAKSGANSFNAYDPGAGGELNASLYTTNANDQLCVACHANGSNPGQPMTRNISGRHNAPGYTGNEAGKDCSGCHSHNQDGAIATVDGLMPLACNGCHSYPGLDNTGTNLKQMSAGHWKHVGQPLPVGNGTNNKGYDCTLCHLSYTHNQSGLTTGQAWPANYYDNVNVNFDNSWNPGSTTYRGLAVPTTGNGGTGACAGLYCHGGNATLNAGWGGSSASPTWNGTVACGACHDTGTTDTTPGTSYSTKNHPVHLTAAYGPGASAFTAGGNCSEGTGCHTRYDLTPGGLHVNNGKDLRSTATDNGYVSSTLAFTQVCRNCHTTYTSVNIPTSGDALVRTQANWDNSAYFVDCMTCHNGTAAGTQATANIDGSGGVAAAIEGTISTMGHGINGGIGCGWCHGDIGHIGANRPVGSNPYRLAGYFFTGTYPPITTLGGIDYICNYCHSLFGPPDHTWRVSGSGLYGPETKGATDTHPTTALAVGTDKGRWYQVPSSTHIPLYGDLMDNNYNKSGGTNNYVLCVSCHDPHGVGTSPVPSTVRRFSGQNTDAKGSKALRFNYSSGTPTALCSQCHK
jgi:predicted CxxxxCH...CXXCH cytochrome family protein